MTKMKKKRILDAMGKVRMSRIDGDLSLSRAFGDFNFKSNSKLGDHEQKVIAIPEYRVVQTNDRSHFLFMACDGIYDVMTNQEIVDFLNKAIVAQKHHGVSDQDLDIGKILCTLLDHCLEKKSQDNMSAILIRFVDGTKYTTKSTEFIPGNFFQDGSDTYKSGYKSFAEAHGMTFQQCLDYLKKKPT